LHLRTLTIKNFRALEDISVDFSTRVSVIVGPNAAGKTTVIEAVRLAKALLAPRTQSEATQILHSLGVSSPHVPQRLRLQAITQDINKSLEIRSHYEFESDEIEILRAAKTQIAMSLIQAQGGQAFASTDALIAFLSSDAGKTNLKAAEEAVEQALAQLASTKRCALDLVFPPGMQPRSEGNPIEAQFIAYMERRLPPHKTAFTYFPADRALPSGEQPVQLGGPDASQQLESYNSQPQLKFSRLKNAIFSAAFLGNEADERPLAEEFERIFNGLLKGRKLDTLGINEIGFLNVQIRDIDSNRVFDLDGMSSGEKGLILTFLMIARSVVKHGIVLLDEPELHLNPAVCKDLLQFIIEEYAKPRNLQIIICTHSPEILTTAFDSDECALYHLMSGTNISRVHTQDKSNISEALRRLGATESDNLLYRGVVFVEGPDDVALLEAGFSHLLRRFKLKPSMGRPEVEKAARLLQENEDSIAVSPSYFILDLDDEETVIKNSKSVRVLQWKRRCLENYLIDLEILTKLLMDEEVVQTPLKNEGEVRRILTNLALSQLRDVAARSVYAENQFIGLGLRKDDLSPDNTEVIANALGARIQTAKQKLESFSAVSWSEAFVSSVDKKRTELEKTWESSWAPLCDGKRLLIDLSKEVTLRMNQKKFKLKLMKEMALSRSPNWLEMEAALKALLQ
jgi:AAA15 family ATPase/GTPase